MRLKLYNKKDYFKYIIVCILIFISLIYLYLFNKYDYIKNLIYKKDNDNEKIYSKLIYSSLNKIVEYNDKVIDDYENNIQKVNVETKETNKKPIIYIYNTHDTETYSLPFVSDYSIMPNVKLASYILKDYLNDYGIESTVETRKIKDYLNKNKLDYSYSYSASRNYMKDELKKYDYEILIDLHRDSTKYKYTLYENNDKKYARIMFVLGQNYKTYKENEKFVQDLNDRINKKYKGISRGVYIKKNSRFNQDLSTRAILLELGGVDNTLEEINNTLEVFASVLNDYINEEIYGRKGK